jgi:DNA-binding winged helix-turn-helix (wHTH) protein
VSSGILEYIGNGKLEFTSRLFKRYVIKLGLPPLIVMDGMVFKGSKTVILSKEEFNLFKILWDNQPNVVSHDQISNFVWLEEKEEGISQNMITVLVMRVRDKLGDNNYIESVRGRGYRFVQGTAPLPRSSAHTSTPPK